MIDLEGQHTQTNKNQLALVLGEDSRSFLSVIRSLGKAGYSIHVVCYDRKSMALKSKYIKAAYFYNYQAYSLQEWITNVVCLIERYDYQIIFPCDERAIYPLFQYKDQLPTTTKLAIINQTALDILFDKWKTKQIAKKLGVPVAKGILTSLDEINYTSLKKQFGEPFVIKPLQSFSADALETRNKVLIVNDEQDYLNYKQNNDHDASYLVEAFFAGHGEAIAVFAWKGEIKAVFAYKRLAEPYFGGGSSYRESNKVDLAQLQATKLICRDTQLTGIAMFEFRRNKQNKRWILVEVNARAWGGMPLAEFAGVDFPKLYADFLCNGKPSLQITQPYRKVRARSLLTDLYEIKRESELKAQKDNYIRATTHLIKRTFSIIEVLTPKESIDSLRIDDIQPFLKEVKTIIYDIFNQTIKKNKIYSYYKKNKSCINLKKQLRKKVQRRMVFICYGNIIRSPFAEKYLHNLVKSSANNIDIISFGFHKKEDRKSPQMAISAASYFDCDLKDHQSKCLSQLDLKETDLLFYFDEKNKNIIHSYYKFNHAYCLSDFLDKKHSALYEIEDPYGSDVKTIAHCYKKIKNAIDNVMMIYKDASAC